jgi:hypothetical protein
LVTCGTSFCSWNDEKSSSSVDIVALSLFHLICKKTQLQKDVQALWRNASKKKAKT